MAPTIGRVALDNGFHGSIPGDWVAPPPQNIQPVKIGEFCSKTPALPVSMQEQETEASRFLSALEKKHEQSRRQVADAISFGQYRKDGGSDV